MAQQYNFSGSGGFTDVSSSINVVTDAGAGNIRVILADGVQFVAAPGQYQLNPMTNQLQVSTDVLSGAYTGGAPCGSSQTSQAMMASQRSGSIIQRALCAARSAVAQAVVRRADGDGDLPAAGLHGRSVRHAAFDRGRLSNAAEQRQRCLQPTNDAEYESASDAVCSSILRWCANGASSVVLWRRRGDDLRPNLLQPACLWHAGRLWCAEHVRQRGAHSGHASRARCRSRSGTSPNRIKRRHVWPALLGVDWRRRGCRWRSGHGDGWSRRRFQHGGPRPPTPTRPAITASASKPSSATLLSRLHSTAPQPPTPPPPRATPVRAPRALVRATEL